MRFRRQVQVPGEKTFAHILSECIPVHFYTDTYLGQTDNHFALFSLKGTVVSVTSLLNRLDTVEICGHNKEKIFHSLRCLSQKAGKGYDISTFYH